MINKKQLNNGLKILYKKTNTKSVTIAVCVKAGCVYEPDELMGVSHFLEHMLFNGTTNRTQSEILTTIEDLGGEINASTYSDKTIYTIKILNKYFDIALDVISDMILNSTLPQTLFDREKKIVLDEINMVYDIPRDYQFTLFKETLFKIHSARKRILGTKNTITNLSREQLLDYYKKYYVVNNLIVSVAGNIKNVFNLISEKFSNVENKKLVFEKTPKPQNIYNKFVETRNISQSYFVMGYVIPAKKIRIHSQ
jgi:predicted Zn-dependent peptidase